MIIRVYVPSETPPTFEDGFVDYDLDAMTPDEIVAAGLPYTGDVFKHKVNAGCGADTDMLVRLALSRRDSLLDLINIREWQKAIGLIGAVYQAGEITQDDYNFLVSLVPGNGE